MNLKKDLAIVGGLFLLVAVLLVFGKGFVTSPSSIGTLQEGTPSGQTATPSARNDGKIAISSGQLSVFARVADESDERKKGLSKMDGLPISEGMLFVFDKSDKYAIWMKDMKFAIDIIWIGQDKRIVDIAHNVPPEPGKDEDELAIYRPKTEALYILEINAGLASLNNLQIGEQVNFEL